MVAALSRESLSKSHLIKVHLSEKPDGNWIGLVIVLPPLSLHLAFDKVFLLRMSPYKLSIYIIHERMIKMRPFPPAHLEALLRSQAPMERRTRLRAILMASTSARVPIRRQLRFWTPMGWTSIHMTGRGYLGTKDFLQNGTGRS